MTVSHVEVLVEEPSAEAALRIILPRILGATTFEVYRYTCKHDLLARLPERLRGYKAWLPADWRVVVVVDRDDDDCVALKTELEKMTHDSERSRPREPWRSTWFQKGTRRPASVRFARPS